MTMRFFAALLLLGVAAALRLPQQQTFMLRRAALQQSAAAAAAAALLAAPAQALDKAEFAKAVADKREAERVAALPASRLKTLRDSLANDAPALLEAGDWGKLRDAIVRGNVLTVERGHRSTRGRRAGSGCPPPPCTPRCRRRGPWS